MDGGVSTEIQKRGVEMNSEVWSGIAQRVNPNIVCQVHEDYIHAGARVITANTFACARHVLESINLGEETKKINNEAVLLAKKARDKTSNKKGITKFMPLKEDVELHRIMVGEIKQPIWKKYNY